MADVFSRWALQNCVKYLPRVAKNPEDREAKSQMLSVFLFLPMSPLLTSLRAVWLLRSLVLDLGMPVFICVTASVTQ